MSEPPLRLLNHPCPVSARWPVITPEPTNESIRNGVGISLPEGHPNSLRAETALIPIRPASEGLRIERVITRLPECAVEQILVRVATPRAVLLLHADPVERGRERGISTEPSIDT